MNDWLDKQEKHHENQAKLIIESKKRFSQQLLRDAMRQAKTMIKNKGWSNAYQYMKEMQQKGWNAEMRGIYELARAYKKISDKMWSLDKK